MKVIDLTQHFNDGTLAVYLSTLPDKMKEAGVRVLDRSTDHIVDLAKQIVRKDTWTLHSTIRKVRIGETGFLVTAGGQEVNPKTGKPCHYAAAVERKYPYMRPAVDMIKPTIATEMEMEVMKSIE